MTLKNWPPTLPYFAQPENFLSTHLLTDQNQFPHPAQEHNLIPHTNPEHAPLVIVVVLIFIRFIVDRVGFFLHGSQNLVISLAFEIHSLLHRMPSRFLHLLHRILAILGSIGQIR
ncbi:hypothetical protein TNCV_2412501 [Trichonephila clavipes]|nr:hypothetical protein TNCV_2412501 [Trichonephila clavipes]